MNKHSCLLAVIVFGWAAAIQAEELPFYQRNGYNLEILSSPLKDKALDQLAASREFERVHGVKQSCEDVYRLRDSTGQVVSYASLCRIRHGGLQGFFCWTESAEHFGYAKRNYGAEPAWIGDAMLHGCGGAFVREPDVGASRDSFDDDGTEDETALAELGWGDQRPVMTMLHSDIHYLGFNIPLRSCEKTRLIDLGPENNTYYGALCEIDDDGTQALICFDNMVGHFGLFTRYQDTSEWVRHTLYRYCWGG
jgi:hypothetical protein